MGTLRKKTWVRHGALQLPTTARPSSVNSQTSVHKSWEDPNSLWHWLEGPHTQPVETKKSPCLKCLLVSASVCIPVVFCVGLSAAAIVALPGVLFCRKGKSPERQRMSTIKSTSSRPVTELPV